MHAAEGLAAHLGMHVHLQVSSLSRLSSTVNPTSASTGPKTSAPQLSLRLPDRIVFTVALGLFVASLAHALGPTLSPLRFRVVMGVDNLDNLGHMIVVTP